MGCYVTLLCHECLTFKSGEYLLIPHVSRKYCMVLSNLCSIHMNNKRQFTDSNPCSYVHWHIIIPLILNQATRWSCSQQSLLSAGGRLQLHLVVVSRYASHMPCIGVHHLLCKVSDNIMSLLPRTPIMIVILVRWILKAIR